MIEQHNLKAATGYSSNCMNKAGYNEGVLFKLKF